MFLKQVNLLKAIDFPSQVDQPVVKKEFSESLWILLDPSECLEYCIGVLGHGLWCMHHYHPDSKNQDNPPNITCFDRLDQMPIIENIAVVKNIVHEDSNRYSCIKLFFICGGGK